MPTLIASIGLLVLLGAGSILVINWVSGRAVVEDLIGGLITDGLTIQERALRRHLDAAVHEANFVAQAIRSGRYDLSDPDLEDFLAGSIAAAPQIDGLVLAAPNGGTLVVGRGDVATGYQLRRLELSKDRQLSELVEDVRKGAAGHWGPPVYRARTQTTYLNYRVPIRRDGAELGVLVVATSTQALSGLSAELSDPPRDLSFMVYGADGVLAHPFMIAGSETRSAEQPLPTLEDFGFRVERVTSRFGEARLF